MKNKFFTENEKIIYRLRNELDTALCGITNSDHYEEEVEKIFEFFVKILLAAKVDSRIIVYTLEKFEESKDIDISTYADNKIMWIKVTEGW